MKVIDVTSCENCPYIRKRALMDYCVLDGTRYPLSHNGIPEWCPLDEVDE